MITDEELLETLGKIREFRPARVFNQIDGSTAGMRFVLVYLSEHSGDIYASTIARELGISRARMGVLISKLISKGLIEKTISTTDARIEVIGLTALGRQKIENAHTQMLSNLRQVIEEVGLEEINKFLITSAKIKRVLDEMEQI